MEITKLFLALNAGMLENCSIPDAKCSDCKWSDISTSEDEHCYMFKDFSGTKCAQFERKK